MNKRVLVTLVVLASVLTLSSAVWPFDKVTKETKRAVRVASQEAEKRGNPKPPPPKKPKKAKLYRDESVEGEVAEIISDNSAFADTITPEDDIKATEEKLKKIWETNMHNFVPEDMVTFLLEKHTAQIFYEEINHIEPTLVKGAYYVGGGDKDEVLSAVMVLGPDQKTVLYKRQNENQGIILFNTTTPGEYQIIFANFAKPGSEKVVTLAIHTYDETQIDPVEYDFNAGGERVIRSVNETEQGLGSEVSSSGAGSLDDIAGDAEIGSLRNILRSVQTMSKQVQSETKMSMVRQDGHNQDLQDNGSWHFWCMIIETLAFVVILVFQLRHLKSQLDNRLIM